MIKLKTMSLFSGCGGMDLGFATARHPKLAYEITWANDFDKSSCATYKQNFGVNIVEGDIWNTDLSKTPAAEVIIGGFPCEDFSIVRGNTRQGLNTKRGLLYTKFVEAVALKLPLFFVAENVKGLLSIENGSAIQKIRNDFANYGYNVQHKLINFADYGVPQERERVIIVGMRNDFGASFTFPQPTHKGKHVPVKAVLEGAESAKYNNEKTRVLPSTVEKLSKIPPGGNYKNLPGNERKNWMSMIYKRLNPDEPSPTILAAGGGGTLGYHYNEPRPLTNRERARIQTFPDNFIFIGSTTEVRRQIGNAVPPLGIQRIAEQLLRYTAEQKQL
jgi:DNA (cytosine-5)-methyltransferase 1